MLTDTWDLRGLRYNGFVMSERHSKRDEETGRLIPRWSDEDILEVVRQETRDKPVADAQSVARELNADGDGIRDRLSALGERGELSSARITGKGVHIYWFPEEWTPEEGETA